ncbi:MAG: MerR family transcriptional regulator [Actinomycetota bacterium]
MLDSDATEAFSINGAMYGIGQFAQLAGVSVRTLRHYDDVGLLTPGEVDGQTGYRSYHASQLRLLNRILALKDLGFSLAEITSMLDAGIGDDELAGMLRLRQAEAQRRLADEERRLSRVAARITLLQGATMSDVETSVVVKSLDAVRVAVVSEPAEGFDVDFGPIFGRLYPALFEELAHAGVAPAGPTYGLYDHRDDDRIDVIAGVVVASDARLDSTAVTIRDLPAVDRAATLVHAGSMGRIRQSYQVLDQWIQDAGERPVALSREVYLDCPPDQDDWVTELQFALA